MAGTSIANLKAMLTLDTSKWMSGFSSAGKTAQTFVGGLQSKLIPSMGGLGAQLGTAAAGVLSVGAALGSLNAGMNQIDRHAKLADRLGITVEEVQKLSLAADLAGTDVELLAKSMLKMGKNIGSGGMTLDKRLFAVADSLAAIPDAGKRAKRAEEIFGKGGLELINVLIQGGKGIRDSANAIDRFGLGMSRIDAAKVEAANDAWTELSTVIGGLRNKFAVELSPTMTIFFKDQLDNLESLINAYERLKKVIPEPVAKTAGALSPGDLLWGPLFNNGGDAAVRGAEWFSGKKLGPGVTKPDAMNSKGIRSADSTGGKSGKMYSGALERGSVAAVSAITNANGINQLAEIAGSSKETVKKLSAIERNTAASTRATTRTPLRPSNLRGVGL